MRDKQEANYIEADSLEETLIAMWDKKRLIVCSEKN